VDVVGTATDEHLVSWVLEYAPAGTSGWVTIATGTAPVVGGVLGTIDPSILADDAYRLRLRAQDANQSASTERGFVVKTTVKPGAFTLTYEDHTIPAPGFPITLRRIYDSKKTLPGDFGPGWSLGFTGIDLRIDANFNAYLTLPDGRRTAFAFSPYKPSPFFPTYVNRYLPAAGVHDTLENTDCSSLALSSGQWFCFPGPAYAPQNFILRTQRGFTYTLNLTTGITSIADRNGNTLTIGPTGVSSSNGRVLTIARDAAGRVTSITDPAGHATSYAYDALGRLATFTDQLGNVTTYDYALDTSYIDTVESQSGCWPLRNEYDDDWHLIATVDHAGARTWRTWDPATRTETIDGGLGRAASYTYDASGNLLTVADPLGGTTTYTYSAGNDVLSVTNPSGSHIERTYDANGNVLTETRHPSPGVNRTTTYTYDALGLLATVTNPLGDGIRYTYDAAGNPTARERFQPGGSVVATDTYTYDAHGNRTSHTDAAGTTTAWEYDAFGDVVRVVDDAGHAHTYEYDANGNPVAHEDDVGNRTEFVYDPLNRLTAFRHDGDTLFTRTWTDDGNVRTHTDALGQTTTYDYDCDGGLVGVQDAAGGTTLYQRNQWQSLDEITDAQGEKTEFGYDAMTRQTWRWGPDLNDLTFFDYAADGVVGTVTTPNGHDRVTTYDQMKRITREERPDRAVDYAWNADGQPATIALTAGGAPAAITTYTQDGVGRTTAIDDPHFGATTYTYDARGLRTGMTTPDGVTTTYGYDAAARLETVTTGADTVTFVHDAAGRRTRTQFSNGTTADYGWDALNRLTSVVLRDVDANVVASFAYTLDGNGLRTAATLEDGAVDYTYDPLYRLTGEAAASTRLGTYTHAWTYDPTGNRLDPGATYGPDGRLLSDASGAYNYDADGNVVAHGTRTYAYDADDRLVGFTDGAVTATYEYDALGRRTAKETASERREFLYDGGNVVAEYRGGVQVARYTQGLGLDQPLMVRQGGHTYFYHTDGLGSVVALSDETGHVVQRYGYDAWGNLRTAVGPFALAGAGLVNRFTYAARELDVESGLYHQRARAYDPALGRFLQKDESQGRLGNPLTQNRYVYALDTPVNATDPTGRTALIEYAWLISGPSVTEVAAALAGFIHGYSAPNVVFIGEYLALVNQGMDQAQLWEESLRRTEAQVQHIEDLLGIVGDAEDCVTGFLDAEATGIPGAFKSGVGFSISISASATLPILSGEAESVAKCFGIENPSAEVKAEAKVEVPGGFQSGAAIGLARLRAMQPR